MNIAVQYLIDKFTVLVCDDPVDESFFLETSAAIFFHGDFATTHLVKRSVAVSIYLQ